MTDTPRWPAERPAVEARYRGERGGRGEKGEKGEAGMTSGARRAYIYLVVLIFGVSAAALTLGVRAYDGLQARQLTQCQFNRDLGNLAKVKVVVSPPTHKPSKVGIAIIADSRAAFRGLGCRGSLDEPGSSFRHWAKTYGLPSD